MNKHTVGLIVLGSLAGCASSAGSAGNTAETTPSSDTKYEIVIARPAVVGQRLRVEVEAAEIVDVLAMDDKNTELQIDGVTEERQVTLAGVLEIMEVDDLGLVHRAQLDVERFYDELGQREVLPAGAKLLATRDGNEFAVVVNGQVPEEDLAGWLRIAFPLARPGGLFVGNALAPASPKAVGETWEISKANVVSGFADEGYETTDTHVTGEVTLVGTPECGGETCLELSGRLHAEQATLNEDWDLTTEHTGVVEGKARMLLPLDASKPVFLEDAEGAGSFVADLKDELNGTTRQVRMQMTRRRVATYVPVT